MRKPIFVMSAILLLLMLSLPASCSNTARDKTGPAVADDPPTVTAELPGQPQDNAPEELFRLNIAPKTVDDSEDVTYTIQITGNAYMGYDENLRNIIYWEIDRDGNTIHERDGYEIYTEQIKDNAPKEGELNRYELKDVATGAVQCIAVSRVTNTGENTYSINTALFDENGSQLTEWGEYDFNGAFGDYVIRALYNWGPGEAGIIRELWDFRNDRVIRDLTGDYSTQYIGCGGMPFKIQYEEDNLIITKLDMAGNHLDNKEMGPDFRYETVVDDCIIVKSGGNYWQSEATYRALDIDLSDVELPARYKIEETLLNPWLVYSDDVYYIYKSASSDASTVYFSHLYKGPEQKLLSDRAFIDVVKDDDGETFFVTEDESSVVVYDYDLNLLYKGNPVPGIAGIESLNNGFYTYMTWISSGDGSFEDCYGLLDSNFNIVIQADYGNPVTFYAQQSVKDFETTELLIIRHRVGSVSVFSVFRLDGTPVTENLTEIYMIGPDRLAVRKGPYVGLIDWQGNWIVKRSAYITLLD